MDRLLVLPNRDVTRCFNDQGSPIYRTLLRDKKKYKAFFNQVDDPSKSEARESASRILRLGA